MLVPYSSKQIIPKCRSMHKSQHAQRRCQLTADLPSTLYLLRAPNNKEPINATLPNRGHMVGYFRYVFWERKDLIGSQMVNQ